MEVVFGFRREVLRAEAVGAPLELRTDAIKASTLHRAILEHEDVDRKHLLWLKEHGGNKAIRNRARQMLNRSSDPGWERHSHRNQKGARRGTYGPTQ